MTTHRAAALRRGATTAKDHVDRLLDSLNELDAEDLAALDEAFVFELIAAQGHLESAASAALPRRPAWVSESRARAQPAAASSTSDLGRPPSQ